METLVNKCVLFILQCIDSRQYSQNEICKINSLAEKIIKINFHIIQLIEHRNDTRGGREFYNMISQIDYCKHIKQYDIIHIIHLIGKIDDDMMDKLMKQSVKLRCQTNMYISTSDTPFDELIDEVDNAIFTYISNCEHNIHVKCSNLIDKIKNFKDEQHYRSLIDGINLLQIEPHSKRRCVEMV